MYHSFEDLEVWKRACQLAVLVHETLKDTREFGLRDQMQRAAVSIPSNIAEGAERGGKDFERFLRIARGSAAELRTQLYIARRIGIVADEPFSQLLEHDLPAGRHDERVRGGHTRRTDAVPRSDARRVQGAEEVAEGAEAERARAVAAGVEITDGATAGARRGSARARRASRQCSSRGCAARPQWGRSRRDPRTPRGLRRPTGERP